MSARTARDVISDWIHFEASIQNGFENSRGKSVNDHADDILSALRSAGFAVVPVDPTKEMLGAGATSLVNDQDHKGVPQMAVSPAYGAYKAMLKAAQEANHG